MVSNTIELNKEYKVNLNLAKQSLDRNQLSILDRMLKSNGKNKVFVTDTSGGFCLVVGKSTDSKMGKLKLPQACLSFIKNK